MRAGPDRPGSDFHFRAIVRGRPVTFLDIFIRGELRSRAR
jgi:hypothetical protein